MITALTILFSSSVIKHFPQFFFHLLAVNGAQPVANSQLIMLLYRWNISSKYEDLKQCFTKLNANVIPTCVIAEIFCQPFCWILSKVLFLWSFIAEMFCQNIFFWHFSKVILSLTLYCWIILSTYIFSSLKIYCWNILSKYILWNFTNDMFIFEDLSLKYFVKIYCLQFI